MSLWRCSSAWTGGSNTGRARHISDQGVLRGSFVGTRKDMAEALAFAAAGKVKADIELQPLNAINNVLERLERGDVPSRVVLSFV